MNVSLRSKKYVLNLCFNGTEDPLRVKVKSTTLWVKVFDAFRSHVCPNNVLASLQFIYEGKDISRMGTKHIIDIIIYDIDSDEITIDIYDKYISTHILVRENTGWDTWKSSWSSLWFERSMKSSHIYRLKRDTTIDDIRIKLAKYYHLNAFNIEIWVPNLSDDKQKLLWNYKLDRRTYWDATIDEIVKKSTVASSKHLYLKFEFVAYDVRNLKNMIQTSKHSRVMAFYELTICTPNYTGLETDILIPLKIIYKKNWKAKQIISKILRFFNTNFIYGLVYFKCILNYLGKSQMTTAIMLHRIKQKQFVICQDLINRTPNTWRMNQLYKGMNYKQDLLSISRKFRLLFLENNDPFVMKSFYKPLWVVFCYKYKRSDNCCRVLLKKNDTLKDIVTRHLSKHIRSIKNSDISFEAITNMCTFILSGYMQILELDTKIYDIINHKSKLLISIQRNTKIASKKREMCVYRLNLTYSSIQCMGEYCSKMEYNVDNILLKYNGETILNAIDLIEAKKIYQHEYRCLSRLLITAAAIYFERCCNNSITTSMIPFNRDTPVHIAQRCLQKLDHFLVVRDVGSVVEYAVKVRYANYICILHAYLSTESLVLKNILFFQLWLIKHRYVSRVFTQEPLLAIELTKCVEFKFVTNMQHIIKTLWNCFDVIRADLNDRGQIDCYEQGGKVLLDVVTCLRFCYGVCKVNANDIVMKMCKKIYQINCISLQSILVKKALSNTLENRPKNKMDDHLFDVENLSLEIDCFRISGCMNWLKQMVRGLKCEWCNIQNKTLKCCKGCKNVWYCCRKHQKFHWKYHHCSS
eukprot:338496_1